MTHKKIQVPFKFNDISSNDIAISHIPSAADWVRIAQNGNYLLGHGGQAANCYLISQSVSLAGNDSAKTLVSRVLIPTDPHVADRRYHLTYDLSWENGDQPTPPRAVTGVVNMGDIGHSWTMSHPVYSRTSWFGRRTDPHGKGYLEDISLGFSFIDIDDEFHTPYCNLHELSIFDIPRIELDAQNASEQGLVAETFNSNAPIYDSGPPQYSSLGGIGQVLSCSINAASRRCLFGWFNPYTLEGALIQSYAKTTTNTATFDTVWTCPPRIIPRKLFSGSDNYTTCSIYIWGWRTNAESSGIVRITNRDDAFRDISIAGTVDTPQWFSGTLVFRCDNWDVANQVPTLGVDSARISHKKVETGEGSGGFFWTSIFIIESGSGIIPT